MMRLRPILLWNITLLLPIYADEAGEADQKWVNILRNENKEMLITAQSWQQMCARS